MRQQGQLKNSYKTILYSNFKTTNSMIHPSMQPHLTQVTELFKKHKIANAFFFGSVLTDKFDENSDVDFLINFQENIDPLERGELWWDLHDRLRDTLNREVDLVSESSLKNPYFIETQNNTKVKIYG